MTKFFRVWAIGLLCFLAPGANALEVQGVRYEEGIDLYGSRLQLNGAGTRYKLTFRVYTAGLYLDKKAKTPDEVFNAGGPKRLTLTMLRDVDANELSRLFIQGIKANSTNAEYGRLLTSLLRMSKVFGDFKKLKAGEVITMDWVPGKGAIIHVRGQSTGEPFTEPAYYRAMLGIWLGPNPADWQLKEALLGL